MSLQYYPWLKSLASVFQNISAAWFGLALVTPNFAPIGSLEGLFLLLLYILFGMLFLIISAQFEHALYAYYD